jgi:hypothetical protein
MTVLEALKIIEAATLECKDRNVKTPEVEQALDVLEPLVQPKWLIPQFRNHLDVDRQPGVAREGQQGLRATFPGIRRSGISSESTWIRSRATSAPPVIRR